MQTIRDLKVKMSKTLEDLGRKLHNIEVEYLKAAEEKDPKQNELWKKYQNTREKYIEEKCK